MMSDRFRWNTCFRRYKPENRKWLSVLFFFLFIGCSSDIMMDWKSCPPIPPRNGMATQFGLAGPVSGASGNYILVAGGANFENGMPWRGGVKAYHDEIFLLEEKSDGSLSWKENQIKLPLPLAYPACVTLKDRFISIGGENDHGPLSKVLSYTFADGTVQIDSLPDLPDELSSLGATVAGDQIYVAGGLDKNGATGGFFSLSLSHLELGWSKLPGLPVVLSHAVVAAQYDGHEIAVFVIGGRNKKGDLTEFLSSVFKFTPSDQKWVRVGDLQHEGKPVSVSAGTGIAFGNNQILLFGGDRGFFFNQTERMNIEIASVSDPVRKDSLLKRKDHFLTNHPGFSNLILVYNTLTGKWAEAGEIPGNAPVTTVAYSWKGKIVIPSGEIRPGVRTDKVIMVEMKEN